MMRPLHPVTTRRNVALIAIRIVELALLVAGLIHLVYIIGFAMVMGDLSALGYGASDNRNSLSTAMSFLLPAALLLALDRRIVKWLIPVPRHECPQCGYALRSLTVARCPECACELPADAGSSERVSKG